MLTSATALDRLAHIVRKASTLGADAADAVYFGDMSSSVQVRLGAIEDLSRSEAEEVGIRVFIGQRSASVASSDLSLAALDAAAERAIDMARQAPEDEYAGLAPEDRLLKSAPPDLDIDDGASVSMEAMREAALAAEDAARAVPGVTNSQGAGASAARACYALATSHGFAAAYAGTSYGTSATVVAGEGAAMQRDYAYHGARHHADLEAAEAIGRRAGERTVARLNPEKLPTGTLPVVFDPRVSGSLLGHLAGAINGGAIARGTSFLMDAMHTPVFAPGIRIHDDPLRVRGLRSRPFDGEGLATRPTALVDDGVLQTWLVDSAAGRQLRLPPTGHATRGVSGPPGASTSNLYMEAGNVSFEDLIADIELGFLVTELIGQGVNGITGDYSRGAGGFRIVKGKLAGPVAEVTIAGNLKAMFREARPANDLAFRYGTNAPSLRVDGMTIAGT